MSFTNYLKLREVVEDDIEKINLDRSLHFDNIFGKKLRIAIPLEEDEDLNKLIEALEELDYEVDYEDLVNKKTVYKKVKTQQGIKVRSEKVGKVLQFHKLTKLLDWWQKNSENIKNSEGKSIIISRSPIDVLRMSDHDGITSCHSPDGGFYKCARQEARTGGAVAYVIKNSDLNKVNLQDKEIFEDADRKINGIVPLERLRLRRFFSSKGGINLLIPDIKTYNDKNQYHPGFAKIVKSWAKSTQKDIASQIDPVEAYKDMKIKGGSYFDTGYESDILWNNFFNTSVTGKKSSDDRKEEDEDEDGNIYERAEQTLRNHQENWNHLFVSLDESENNLIYSAHGSFNILKKMFLYDLNDKKVWFELKRKIEDSLDIVGIEDLNFEEDTTSFRFIFSFYDSAGAFDQLTNFERFLDYVDAIDRRFEDIVNGVYGMLWNEGYIKNLAEKLTFKNLQIDFEDYDNTYTIQTKEPEKIGHLKDFLVDKIFIDRDGKIFIKSKTGTEWGDIFIKDYVNKSKVLPFKVKEENFELFLTTNGSQTKPYDVTRKVEEEGFTVVTGWMYFIINVTLGLNPYQKEQDIKKIKNLDNNWHFYVRKLASLFDMFLANNKAVTATSWPSVRPDPVIKFDKFLSKKPIFKKPPKQFNLNFKDWFIHNVV